MSVARPAGAETGTERRRVLAVVLAALATVVASCGVAVSYDDSARVVDDSVVTGDDFDAGGPDSGDTDTSTPTTLEPPTDVVIHNDTGSEINRIAANAIRDLENFWVATYPATFDGETYQPLSGGYWAINRNLATSTLPCRPTDINQVLNNAYYCGFDDAIAWDEELLMPSLAAEFGDFTVAVVLAHEWGHAIQERRAMDEPTVVMELQADCYAGAWVQHVVSSGESRFEVNTEQLDQALAGVLSLRDAPGAEADDPNAHGSGFDRVSAFQSGFEEGAGRCRQFRVGDPQPYQFPFDDEDFITQGDMEYSEIKEKAFGSLDGYWADVFPALSGGKAWTPMEPARAFTTEDPPECAGREVTQYRLFLCVPDRYVGYDDGETMPRAYELGDFAVAALFGTQYGLEVQDQLQRPPGDEITATVRADCFTGAWAGALLPGAQVDEATARKYVLGLSSGDLDEAVAVMLTFRTDSDRERQGPGFARVKAFRTGVVDGAGACIDLTA
ncbi:MAG: peptidase [Acidimicrobiales bacterium]|nr:peptidase [Acidimicrobiales bacterium]